VTKARDDEGEVTLPPDVARASYVPRPPLARVPRIARYEIEGELGGGSVGVILAAVDRETGRKVALKVPLQEFDHAEIELEARVTAKLDHPAIVPVYDAGFTDCGRPYYAMRLVGRRSLRDVLLSDARAEWSRERLVAVLAQVASALAYAHARGVVHRDLKPGNVLVGESDEVYLADWGLARITPGSDVANPSTDTTGLIGTPGYLAPELLSGAEHDYRADLFSFGVVLYEVLTGQRPFRRESPSETFTATREHHPPPPATGTPLDDFCMKLLAKDPAQRPASAEEVVHFFRGLGIP
jgi:eukaryotic-like serine/threonine-protein kinase